MRNYLILLFILFSASQFSCSPRQPVDRTGVNQEMKKRELKRLTNADLILKGEEIGTAILQSAETAFQQELKQAIAEKGIKGAIEHCNTRVPKLIQDLEDSLQVRIKRLTDRTRNPSDSLAGIEKKIWEAYTYAPDMATSQIQELNEQTLILTKPIRIQTGLCLNCHGGIGNEITDENYSVISSLYPDDQAVGYKIGDLRGMWSIIIPKKVVVNQL